MNLRVPALQVAIAIVIAGCVKIEKFSFRDAGRADDGGRGNDADGSETGIVGASARVEGANVVGELPGRYRLVFSDHGYHFPTQLLIGSNNVLGPEPPSDNCATEHGAGVTYSPAAAFSSTASPGLTAATPTIRIVYPGPVAKVALDWGGTFTGCTGAPSGRSTFSFFPDGRIQRMDAASIDVSANAPTCQCTGDGAWVLSTYYTFLESAVNNLSGVTRPSGDGASETAAASICFNGPAASPFQLALAWRAEVNRRMRRIGTTLAAIGDMATPGADSGSGLLGDTSTTMIVTSGTTCADLHPIVDVFAEDVQIEISNPTGTSTDTIGLGQDGIYGGEHSQNPDQPGWYTGTTSPVIIRARTGDTVPPFAVRLNLEDRPTIVSVTRQPASPKSEWYTVQTLVDTEGNPTGEYLFWFDDGLAGSDQISIEVAP